MRSSSNVALAVSLLLSGCGDATQERLDLDAGSDASAPSSNGGASGASGSSNNPDGSIGASAAGGSGPMQDGAVSPANAGATMADSGTAGSSTGGSNGGDSGTGAAGGGAAGNSGGSDASAGGTSTPDDAGVGDASTPMDSGPPPFCTPFATGPCYEGDPATENVGPCHAGTQTCLSDGSAWGSCLDQVVPVTEICSNGTDDDCDIQIDESEDLDGDGWGVCDNDCCDSDLDCAAPSLVNPGAYEILSNAIDDDCDVATSDSTPPSACDSGEDLSVTAAQLGQALDICQTTTSNPPLSTKKWGLISVQHLNADGSSPNGARLIDLQNWQSAALVNYGANVVPQAGNAMVGMSTGRMRDVGDTGYVAPNTGTDFGAVGLPPAAYLSANGGSLPSSTGCSGACPAGGGANDSVNLRLVIRVPTNVQGLQYQYRFFSSEYWSYSCTAYNDFSLALLTSSAPGIPADRNIAYDALGNPMSVNSGFFEVCQANGCYTCPLGFGDLTGTGMDADGSGAAGLQRTGGGTPWLTVSAPVLPGETITLDLMIFDVSDGVYDSVLLLDNFRWVP